MIRINLVPQDILDKARQKQMILQGAAAAAGLAAVLALVSFGQYVRYKSLQNQSAKAAQKLKALQVVVSEVQELEKTEKAIRDRLDVINGLLKNRPLYPDFMSDFAREVPAGVQVQALTTAGGGNAGTTLKISLSASAHSNDDIARWIGRMQDSGRFDSAILGTVSAQGAQDARTYSFSLTTNYTPKL